MAVAIVNSGVDAVLQLEAIVVDSSLRKGANHNAKIPMFGENFETIFL